MVVRDFGAPAWLSTRRTLTVVRDTWRAVRPLGTGSRPTSARPRAAIGTGRAGLRPMNPNIVTEKKARPARAPAIGSASSRSASPGSARPPRPPHRVRVHDAAAEQRPGRHDERGRADVVVDGKPRRPQLVGQVRRREGVGHRRQFDSLKPRTRSGSPGWVMTCPSRCRHGDRPPGATTRANPFAAACGSARCWNTRSQRSTCTDPFAKGRSAASPSTHVALDPSSAIRCTASARRAGFGSTPTAPPLAATAASRRRTSVPCPSRRRPRTPPAGARPRRGPTRAAAAPAAPAPARRASSPGSRRARRGPRRSARE